MYMKLFNFLKFSLFKKTKARRSKGRKIRKNKTRKNYKKTYMMKGGWGGNAPVTVSPAVI